MGEGEGGKEETERQRDREEGRGGKCTQDFMVVFLEHHLDVQSDEFGHVSVCVGILRPKDRADLKHLLQIATHRHLLVQLGENNEGREKVCVCVSVCVL